MEAAILAIRHGLKSRREIVAEQGRDLADVWSDLAAEQADAEAQGIVIADLIEAEAADAEDEPAQAEESDTEDDTQTSKGSK
jgi:capsid protein